MKRRSFVRNTLLTTAASGLTAAAGAASLSENASGRLWYEWRTYTFTSPEQTTLVKNYWSNAAIPALGRLGIKNIGVFSEMKTEKVPMLFVLIPLTDLSTLTKIDEALAKDKKYLEAATAYLNATAQSPAYARIESSLLHAFEKYPTIVLPPSPAGFFELRRYESATEMAGRKKIDMFNNVGEIAIFKKTGLHPVFFGETVIGELRPNLTYLLSFDDMAAHDNNWKAFGGDPEWARIKALPGYADADIVSHITSTFILRESFSQV